MIFLAAFIAPFFFFFCPLRLSLRAELLAVEEAEIVVEVDHLDAVLWILLEDHLEVVEVVEELALLVLALDEVDLSTHMRWLRCDARVHLVVRVALDELLAGELGELVVHRLEARRGVEQVLRHARSRTVAELCHLFLLCR